MTRRGFGIAYCVLFFGGAMLAQSNAVPPDPISGTWTGDLGTNQTNRIPITMELKFDGTATVVGNLSSGPAVQGEIKTGTFDPRTGALKLEVDVTFGGRDTLRFVFDGTVVTDTAQGRATADQVGDFKITKRQTSPVAVSFERILRANEESQNWLTYSGTVIGQRHSLLTQITPANVKNLELAWIWQGRQFAWRRSRPGPGVGRTEI